MRRDTVRGLLRYLESELDFFDGRLRRSMLDYFVDIHELHHACLIAFDQADYSYLRQAPWLGPEARPICLAVAEYYGWEDGDAEHDPIESGRSPDVTCDTTPIPDPVEFVSESSPYSDSFAVEGDAGVDTDAIERKMRERMCSDDTKKRFSTD